MTRDQATTATKETGLHHGDANGDYATIAPIRRDMAEIHVPRPFPDLSIPDSTTAEHERDKHKCRQSTVERIHGATFIVDCARSCGVVNGDFQNRKCDDTAQAEEKIPS